MEAIVTISTEMEHNYIGTSLLVGVAEKLVDYSAPNGEQEHHDVFRKALTAIEGDDFTLPAVGQSTSLSYSISNDADWDFSEMFFYAILNNDENKQVIQSQAADPDDSVTSLDDYNIKQSISVYPNPTRESVTISIENREQATAKVFAITGDLLLQKKFSQQTQLDLSDFSTSIYFLEVSCKKFTPCQYST